MRTKGYTLVELLVVVAVIAILAAMIAPVLLQAKESARMRCCAENLHQLSLAISRYMDDNNGYGLPRSPSSGYPNPWIFCAEPLIPRYIPGSLNALRNRESAKSHPKALWVCPGDIYRGNLTSGQPFWHYCGSSYMYPGPGAYISGTSLMIYDSDSAPRKPLTWRNHRRDILLADYWFDFHSGQSVEHNFGTGSLVPPAWVSTGFSKIINVLFLDLHLGIATPAERYQYQKYTLYVDNPNPPAQGN